VWLNGKKGFRHKRNIKINYYKKVKTPTLLIWGGEERPSVHGFSPFAGILEPNSCERRGMAVYVYVYIYICVCVCVCVCVVK